MTRRIPLRLRTLDPTPVESVSVSGGELWVKRDDRTHEVYGGNKVRKLEWLLSDALARGAKRVVTIGAVGSHHVLATTYFGTKVGLEVEAVLVPQPATDHAMDVLRAGLGLGLRAFPVSWRAQVPLATTWRALHGAHVIPVGGSNALGAMGYVSAASEFAQQVRQGDLPEPDVCVVALGSGGTAAGLAAGFEAEGLKTSVVGVCVADPPELLEMASMRLARACLDRTDGAARRRFASLRSRLIFDRRFLGPGYGRATPEGEAAVAVARDSAGLELDPTYTAKTFAAALARTRESRDKVVLYWHTLSSAPMQPLLADAPPLADVPPRLRRLAR